MYKQHIQLAASSASGRPDYKKVCATLRRYKKIAGKQSTERMIQELSIVYKRRPAFVDELSKVL